MLAFTDRNTGAEAFASGGSGVSSCRAARRRRHSAGPIRRVCVGVRPVVAERWDRLVSEIVDDPPAAVALRHNRHRRSAEEREGRANLLFSERASHAAQAQLAQNLLVNHRRRFGQHG